MNTFLTSREIRKLRTQGETVSRLPAERGHASDRRAVRRAQRAGKHRAGRLFSGRPDHVVYATGRARSFGRLLIESPSLSWRIENSGRLPSFRMAARIYLAWGRVNWGIPQKTRRLSPMFANWKHLRQAGLDEQRLKVRIDKARPTRNRPGRRDFQRRWNFLYAPTAADVELESDVLTCFYSPRSHRDTEKTNCLAKIFPSGLL